MTLVPYRNAKESEIKTKSLNSSKAKTLSAVKQSKHIVVVSVIQTFHRSLSSPVLSLCRSLTCQRIRWLLKHTRQMKDQPIFGAWRVSILDPGRKGETNRASKEEKLLLSTTMSNTKTVMIIMHLFKCNKVKF